MLRHRRQRELESWRRERLEVRQERETSWFAEVAGVESVVIDANTELRRLKQELRQDEIYYHLAPGFRCL